MRRSSAPPVLNELIEAYGPTARKYELDKAESAAGECWVAAAGFAQLAKRLGVKSEWVEFSIDSSPHYAGRSEMDGFEVHAVSVIDICGERVMVDWTASQYGIDEFPMVRIWNEDGLAIHDRSVEPIDCNGDRLETGFIDAIVNRIKKLSTRSVLTPA
jgi:hypothetical protein